MFSGITTVLVWRNFPQVAGFICAYVPGVPASLAQNAPDLSKLIWEPAPGFGVVLLSMVIVSLATGRPRYEVIEQFDMVSDYSRKLHLPDMPEQ